MLASPVIQLEECVRVLARRVNLRLGGYTRVPILRFLGFFFFCFYRVIFHLLSCSNLSQLTPFLPPFQFAPFPSSISTRSELFLHRAHTIQGTAHTKRVLLHMEVYTRREVRSTGMCTMSVHLFI